MFTGNPGKSRQSGHYKGPHLSDITFNDLKQRPRPWNDFFQGQVLSRLQSIKLILGIGNLRGGRHHGHCKPDAVVMLGGSIDSCFIDCHNDQIALERALLSQSLPQHLTFNAVLITVAWVEGHYRVCTMLIGGSQHEWYTSLAVQQCI